MKFCDELMKEYVNGGKIDICKRVKKRQVNPKKINSERKHLFGIYLTAYMSDMIVLITEYEQSATVETLD
jgi:hypothetical protein